MTSVNSLLLQICFKFTIAFSLKFSDAKSTGLTETILTTLCAPPNNSVFLGGGVYMTGSGRLYLTILAFETENNGSTVQILYYRNIHRLEVQGLLGPNLAWENPNGGLRPLRGGSSLTSGFVPLAFSQCD